MTFRIAPGSCELECRTVHSLTESVGYNAMQHIQTGSLWNKTQADKLLAETILIEFLLLPWCRGMCI